MKLVEKIEDPMSPIMPSLQKHSPNSKDIKTKDFMKRNANFDIVFNKHLDAPDRNYLTSRGSSMYKSNAKFEKEVGQKTHRDWARDLV